jgi:A/G-specific adenine glycosylase
VVNVTPKKFQTLLLDWFDQHGRKNLPWQQNKTPYRIWVSEIMLQQTQVSTVIAYFERFMQHFPNITTLANAPEDEVLHLWTGLGYYNRARNLQRAAKIITTTLQGNFPNNVTELENLPGIGRSTAGAIVAIAFQKPAPILDGNVKRVLTRIHGIEQWPGEKKISDALWQIAEKFTPQQRSADYTQAIMDLGATLCIRGKPQCVKCPMQKICVAHAKGIAKKLPIAKARKTIPTHQATLLILQQHPHWVLLEKRPATGVWGNLWSLPEMKGKPSTMEIQNICQDRFGLKMKALRVGKDFRHTFSHFHLDITPAFIELTSTPKTKIMESAQQIWYNLKMPQAVGLPAPVKSLLVGITS